MTDTNLPALGRFKPGDITGVDTSGETKVSLRTNLTGNPVRFVLNEDLNNPVSSATLLMLNASLGDSGRANPGVVGELPSEEDEARWGTLYQQATIEPNQYVEVWEIKGQFTTSVDEYENPVYTPVGNGEVCHTYWRVTSATAYTDDNGIPYYEVALESLVKVATESSFDPSLIADSFKEFILYLDETYYQSLLTLDALDADNDGYALPDELESQFDGIRTIADIDTYLTLFFTQISQSGFDFTGDTEIDLTWIPALKVLKKGENLWKIIEDILAFNGKMARFKRDKELITWSVDGTESPLGDLNIGAFGKGFNFSYSKEGVYNECTVVGYLGVKNSATDLWIPGELNETTAVVRLQAATNILNGATVNLVSNIDADHWLVSTAMLKNYGKRELFKSVLGARGVSYSNDSLPLELEVGMNLIGSSMVGGTIGVLVTTLNRTTDTQQNKISTNVSGTVLNNRVLSKPWNDWPNTNLIEGNFVADNGYFLGYGDSLDSFRPWYNITQRQVVNAMSRAGFTIAEEVTSGVPATTAWIAARFPVIPFDVPIGDYYITRFKFVLLLTRVFLSEDELVENVSTESYWWV